MISPLLALKLIVTPALIGAVSLAGRRWGPGVSGWLVGLPFTSGPIAFFLALAQGQVFARAAATGSLTGALSQAAFCLAYAWLAARAAWPTALAAGALVFAAATAALQGLNVAGVVPPGLLALGIGLALAGALWLMPRTAAAGPRATHLPAWDLPARMLLATAFVLVLTALAPAFGPQLTGLLAPFPVYASILAAFAHEQQGPGAAAGVLRGLLLGLFAFGSFFLVLAALIVPAGIAAAFAAAIVAGLAVQGITLWVMQRRR